MVSAAVKNAMLQNLFLQQLVLLRQQTAAKFLKASRPAEAVSQADQQFVSQAEELKRPGSSWSYSEDRYALRAVLEGSFRRDAAFRDEEAEAVKSQQNTVEIISRLQSQMENLQMRLQHMRAGQPWFLSSSYRIPGTPVTMIGRFQQGRASIELNLSPDRDPVTAEAGFVRGVGPANLGVSGPKKSHNVTELSFEAIDVHVAPPAAARFDMSLTSQGKPQALNVRITGGHEEPEDDDSGAAMVGKFGRRSSPSCENCGSTIAARFASFVAILCRVVSDSDAVR
ncbi:hypothetical protein AK812_SmicGene33649 [Symbiodinium microadriaticum]|uniref:Uncharacterized protein n=1 Tax=Symbiodinium microadriaticum TaxID=2951 RepID=A0A1Q9CR36_SYMMI|nr:hypothetical protein AK812_SmicGene33649 [Symbiodinium microadriaticum]